MAAQTVDRDTQDTMVNISYSAEPQTTHVNYVDESGKLIHQTTIDGKTDQTVKVSSEVPAGWHVIDGKVPSEVTFTADGYPDTTIKIAHSHTTVEPSSPKTSTDKLPDNPSKAYPAGVGESDLNKTITRTINVTDQHGKTTTTKQVAHLTRSADVDEVTGDVTYSDWTSGEWESVKVPEIAGYTASQAEVAAQAVTSDTKDAVVNISYTANQHKTHVNYVTESGITIHQQTLTGTTDQSIEVPSEVPAGWHIVNGPAPSTITFGADGYSDTTVTIAHSNVTIEPTTPKTSDDKLPDNPAKAYPAGVGESDLNKTVTRTINVTDQNGKTTTTKQEAHLTRSADVDEVTGKVAYSDWTTGEWKAVKASEIAGYTPSQAEVAAQAVTSDTKDTAVNITYTANPHTTHVNYVDEDGKQVHQTTIDGKTDQTVSVPSEVPAGWHVVTGEVPAEVTFGADGHADTTVTIAHSHVTVEPTASKTSDDKLPDNPAKTYPAGVGESDLNKMITRTINVTDQNGETKTTKQVVHLTRSADVDEGTGEVTYSDWSTGEWDAFKVPTISGYTPSQSRIEAKAVNSETKDTTIALSYTANQQTITIEVVDDNGNVIGTKTIEGVTGEPVPVSLPNYDTDRYELIDEVPSEHTMTADDNTVIKVHVKHKVIPAASNTVSTDSYELSPKAEFTSEEGSQPESSNSSNGVTSAAEKEASLPQTGENQGENIAISAL